MLPAHSEDEDSTLIMFASAVAGSGIANPPAPPAWQALQLAMRPLSGGSRSSTRNGHTSASKDNPPPVEPVSTPEEDPVEPPLVVASPDDDEPSPPLLSSPAVVDAEALVAVLSADVIASVVVPGSEVDSLGEPSSPHAESKRAATGSKPRSMQRA
jgi:hypothetical protein